MLLLVTEDFLDTGTGTVNSAVALVILMMVVVLRVLLLVDPLMLECSLLSYKNFVPFLNLR